MCFVFNLHEIQKPCSSDSPDMVHEPLCCAFTWEAGWECSFWNPTQDPLGKARSTVFIKHPRWSFTCCSARTTVWQVDRAAHLEKEALDIYLHTCRAPSLLSHLGETWTIPPGITCKGPFCKSGWIPSFQLGCFFWWLLFSSHWPLTGWFSSGASPWEAGLKSNLRLWAHVTPGFVAQGTRIHLDFVF